MKKYAYLTAALFLVPGLAAAQPSGPAEDFGYVGGFFEEIIQFINEILIPLVFAVALLAFLYGMYLYFIQKGASDDAREKGRQLALWSVVGFVLMVSIWGIVSVISTGLFGAAQDVPDLPGTPTIDGS